MCDERTKFEVEPPLEINDDGHLCIAINAVYFGEDPVVNEAVKWAQAVVTGNEPDPTLTLTIDLPAAVSQFAEAYSETSDPEDPCIDTMYKSEFDALRTQLTDALAYLDRINWVE